MKVTRSAIHRLEVQMECGCKAAGEYDDEACKQQRGDITVTACEKHKEMAATLQEFLPEMVKKEAKETVIPEKVHPRTLAMQAAITGDVEAPSPEQSEKGPTVRTLRTSGATGATRVAGAGSHRPANAPAPAPSKPGSHRPTGGGSGKPSPFRRAEASPNLSANAQRALAARGGAKVASSRPSADASGISFGDGDIDAVPEDPRVTKLLLSTNALGDDEDDEGDLDLDL